MTETPDDNLWMTRLTESERLELLRKRRIVQWWEEARQEGKRNGRREPEVTAGFLLMVSAIGWELSRSTLFGWRRSYLANGLRGLHDERSAAVSGQEDYHPFLAELRRRYLGGGLLSARVCYQLTVDEAKSKKWAVPTLRYCRRFLNAVVLPALRREKGTD
ncbi:hypothetical protein [Humisphaera borealis]|uniref:Uncharacterized protein n=1 Tax=Humisphaera borealis TaxID=2807512 RepID=A0A7M2WVB4_9BACT|nr:hypothetical protein [Humisphaera borealis]QOV88430.1 hypothetical protein IPV69_19570 [Humisphaera borealis]